MLRLEREGVREVQLEVGGALARDAVEEIERDVVKSGITESVHRAPDVVGCCLALEHVEQLRPERLRAERDAVTPCSRRSAASSGVTVSGFASTVSSSAAGSAASSRASAAARVNVGVPPPTNTVSTTSASPSRSRSSSASSASTYAPCSPSRPTAVTKSQ